MNSKPVLIVGGGPVGMAMAIDLGWRNIPAVLIEKDAPDARRSHPRMDNVGIRSMEFCRRWGIVGEVADAGFPCDLPISIVYTTGVLGDELARDVYPDRASAHPPAFSPEKHELCPQNFFDPVLQRASSRYPMIELRYGCRLVGMLDYGTHVEASIEDVATGEVSRIDAAYLVGCDGAGGTTATILGEAAAGQVLSCSTNIFFEAPDLARRTADARAYRYLLMGDDGVWATIVNIDGRDVWRLQVLGDDSWPSWSDAQIAAMVRRGIGADVPFTVRSWMPWSRREYVATNFRVGRCFLVGDAAHQLSPTGGYGMNTGIAEAVDLSWKLAATIAGWGGAALLDSYQAERRPIAVRNVAQASHNLRAMRSVLPAAGYRDAGVAGEAARAETGEAIQLATRREWRSFGIHLGFVYRGSPIVDESGEDDRPDPDIAAFEQSARAGARAPHVWIAPGRSTLDLFGRGFVLLDLSGEGEPPVDLAPIVAAAAERGVPLSIETLALAAVRAAYERRLVLVRPDGHVAWRGDRLPTDPYPLIDRVRGAAPTDERKVSMTTVIPTAEQLAELKARTASLPRPWVSEVVLQTNQFDIMKPWYSAVLGGDWFVENTPDPSVVVDNHHGDGGKQVHAKDVRACFMRLPTVDPYGQVFALFELDWLTKAPGTDPGINHMQFKHVDLAAVIERVELLRDVGIVPHRSANHGPMTSFYFRDPDENIIELCVDNFRNQAEMMEIIQSPAFRANPSGIDLDVGDFIARFRSGVLERELLKL